VLDSLIFVSLEAQSSKESTRTRYASNLVKEQRLAALRPFQSGQVTYVNRSPRVKSFCRLYHRFNLEPKRGVTFQKNP